MKKERPFRPDLKRILEDLRKSYAEGYIDSDPVSFVHGQSTFRDREMMAAISSSLAFGSVAQIKRSVLDVLARMNGEPSRYVEEFEPGKARRDFRTFVHRFIRGDDFACFLHLLSQAYRRFGSLRSLFMAGYDPAAETLESAIAAFVRSFYSLDCTAFFGGGVLPRTSRARFLFISPEAGSACKRMNMFLRWMVRRSDGIDFGLWEEVSPSQLVMPLDTHVSRIARNMGLSRRRTADWKMALEVTRNLRRFDGCDPVKYDFAFSRLGILGVCSSRGIREDGCPLSGVCTCIG